MKKPNFTEQELNDVTNYSKWGNRNRLLLLMTHMTGIRRNELPSVRGMQLYLSRLLLIHCEFLGSFVRICFH